MSIVILFNVLGNSTRYLIENSHDNILKINSNYILLTFFIIVNSFVCSKSIGKIYVYFCLRFMLTIYICTL